MRLHRTGSHPRPASPRQACTRTPWRTSACTRRATNACQLLDVAPRRTLGVLASTSTCTLTHLQWGRSGSRRRRGVRVGVLSRVVGHVGSQIHFKAEVCSGSGHPAEAVPWVREIENTPSMSPFLSPNFQDARCQDRHGLEKDPTRVKLSRRKILGKQKGFKRKPISPKAAVLTHDLRVVSCNKYVRIHSGLLMSVTLRGDDMQGFDTRWDEVLLSIEEAPQVHIPESMYKRRIRESERLETVSSLNDQATEHEDTRPSYTRLKKRWPRSSANKKRDR